MFTYKRKINFHDCDPAGILFFARIFELCHSAYEEMISSFELGEDYWNNPDYVVPILHSEAKYRNPLKYGDTAGVEIQVTVLKDSSFELSYKCRNQNGDDCAEVRTVHVFVERSSWKKHPMKESIKNGLAKHTAG